MGMNTSFIAPRAARLGLRSSARGNRSRSSADRGRRVRAERMFEWLPRDNGEASRPPHSHDRIPRKPVTVRRLGLGTSQETNPRETAPSLVCFQRAKTPGGNYRPRYERSRAWAVLARHEREP